MSSKSEVLSALSILSGARLRGAPAKDETAQVAQTWIRIMQDVPGTALTQAVEDHIMVSDFWPTPAAIRKAAANVRAHNFTSAAPNPFKDDSRERTAYKGIYRVTKAGWQPVNREELAGRERCAELPDEEPPAHPEFGSWAEAQAWQEKQQCIPL